MGSDCTVPIDDGLLNIRVGAIICRGNEFLMMENDKDPFLYSVGGRVKFGETAQRGNCTGKCLRKQGHRWKLTGWDLFMKIIFIWTSRAERIK